MTKWIDKSAGAIAVELRLERALLGTPKSYGLLEHCVTVLD